MYVTRPLCVQLYIKRFQFYVLDNFFHATPTWVLTTRVYDKQTAQPVQPFCGHTIRSLITDKARRTWWNKTEIKQNCRRPAVSFQPTVNSFVLFQFHHLRTLKLFQVVSVFYFRDVRKPEIKQKMFFVWADHRQHCLTAVFIQTSAHPWNKTLKQF